jgi:hypothetical protein
VLLYESKAEYIVRTVIGENVYRKKIFLHALTIVPTDNEIPGFYVNLIFITVFTRVRH